MKYIFYFLIFSLSITFGYSQKGAEYAVHSIPDSLKLNANAVVRLERMNVKIASQRDLSITNTRVVTVFNEQGKNAIGAATYYNKRTSIRSINASVYDAFGNELKKFKSKDFRDQSMFDGYSIALDGRIIYLDYTPTQYPFTIVFDSEISTSNTALLPQWQPLSEYFVSVEKSILNVNFPSKLGLHTKEYNFSGFPINKTIDTPENFSYTATNLIAQKRENYSPESSEINPKVIMSIENFNLEGVDGNAKNWKEFGQWYSDKILEGTTELPEETKSKIRLLVGNEKDPIEKARMIYNYVQQKSRYVSIQLGIGGWKPMLASDVDRLSYGDCKALTNYTKALLETVGITAYNTILYADRYVKKNIESDVVSIQGNHMMLAIPDGQGYTWLECTSQDVPFGYQANFTDDRNVLVIKPDGAEIVKTKRYDDSDNSQTARGKYSLNEKGDLTGEIILISEGAKYGQKFHLNEISPTEKDAYYKEFWSNINNLKINSTAFDNDRRKASFTEKVNVGAINYGITSGDKMFFVVNAYDSFSDNVKRIRNRRTPFQVLRGFMNSDEIIVELLLGFAIESMPDKFAIETKFGKYKSELIKVDETHLLYKRSFSLNKGLYQNKEYEEYRLFLEQVSRNDNAKIVLTKKIIICRNLRSALLWPYA